MDTKFKIETVKWKWPNTVKSPDIYRDDEFVRTKTKEEALNAIDFLLENPKGLTYTITVFRDEEYFTYWRHSMPCIGGLVKYLDSHGERYFMNPYFPRDIRVPYPEGDTVYIACRRERIKSNCDTIYYKFILSQESPWVSAFGSKESIIFKDNYFVLTDMNTDPTVFYSLMRLGGFASHSPRTTTPKAEILFSLSHIADPRRLAGQKPIKISGGTWAEGFGYTRPYNESIFKTTLPTRFEDFRKLSSYPQVPFTNTYLAGKMKSVFNVDVSKGLADEKVKDALTEAWDYFKEKAKELVDFA